MKNQLSRIEARLQALIEGGAARLFSSPQGQKNLIAHLLQALQAGIVEGAGGELIAPNLFLLIVSPRQAFALEENRALLEGLAFTLREVGEEAGLRFSGPLVVRVQPEPGISPDDWQVQARNSMQGLTDTSDLEVLPVAAPPPPAVPPRNAFLIVDGTRIFTLNGSVVNIGRRADNQLAIDDPRVSRLHAQLRLVRGRYVIFDLDSTGGTLVNGEPVRQGVLMPGDVISLAGVPLVYGQEEGEADDTQDLSDLY